MTDAATLTVTSFIHGRRVWRRVGERVRTRRNGREIALATWKSGCVVCGQDFEITTPRSVETVEQSKAFCATTCLAHRMTPSETARLRSAARDQRRAVFAALKRSKLEARIAEPAPPCRTPLPEERPMTLDPGKRWRRFMSCDRAEQFRERHTDLESLTDEAIDAIIEMMEHEEAQADDELAERLASCRRPSTAPTQLNGETKMRTPMLSRRRCPALQQAEVYLLSA